jgi:hypothetical protein
MWYVLLLLRGDTEYGVPCTATVTDKLRFQIWVLIIPDTPNIFLWQ